MHKYLRAIGFSKMPKRKEIQEIISSGINHPSYRMYTSDEDDEDCLLAQFNISLGGRFGLSVCGQFDETDQFYPEFYYPYLDSDNVSTSEDVTVDRRLDNDSYAGICDDLKVGVTLIFRLRNSVEYIRNRSQNAAALKDTTITLTALSTEGTVMMPIFKTASDIQQKKRTEIKRRKLMNAAREGDENAIKDLTIQDMDMYSNIYSRIQYDDIFTLVESYFMPHGSECDLYSVLGEITACDTAFNGVTGEKLWLMTIDCNGLQFDLAINALDLFGEPAVGRRFKGVVWLQGKINFQDTIETDPIRCEQK